MLQDQSLFTHIGITLDRNARQFCIHGSSRDRHSRSSVVHVPRLSRDPGALSRRPEQSSEIRPCPSPHRMAGCKYTNDHRRRNVCGNLWLDHQSLHRLPRSSIPEKQKLIRTLGGTKKDELTKIVLPSSVPLILSVMKVNIGLVPGWRDHRRIHWCKTGTRIPDHLRFPDV